MKNNENNHLKISHYVQTTKVLGPYTRSALWVHGCRFHCPGCIAAEMNVSKPEICDFSELADVFIGIADTEGITISGGEPFLQAGNLAKMVQKIKSVRDYGVIVYTGFQYEQLIASKDEEIHYFLEKTDILIDGRYIKELDDNIPYRGSSNQQIISLSDRYRDIMEEYYHGTDKRNVEINVTEHKIYLVGVPSENSLRVWEDFRKKAGVNGAV